MALKIKIINSTDKDFIFWVDFFQKKITAEKDLSPRGVKELKSLLSAGGAYVLEWSGQVVGFLIFSRLSRSIVEVHSLYTEKSFRRQGVDKKLIGRFVGDCKESILTVSFHSFVKDFFKKFEFKELSFFNLPLFAKFNFIKERCRLRRLVAIFKFWSKNKPIYLLKE